MTNTTKLARSLMLLRLVCYGLLVFVAIWFVAVFPGIDQPARLLLDTIVWPIDGSHDVLSRDARFLSGIGAGLLTAMALNILLVVVPELEVGNFRVLRGAALAIFAWYVVDSVGSYASGVPSNVLFNTGFLLLLLYPLWLAAQSQSRGKTPLQDAT